MKNNSYIDFINEEDNEVIENALKDYEILKKVIKICGTKVVNVP